MSKKRNIFDSSGNNSDAIVNSDSTSKQKYDNITNNICAIGKGEQQCLEQHVQLILCILAALDKESKEESTREGINYSYSSNNNASISNKCKKFSLQNLAIDEESSNDTIKVCTDFTIVKARKKHVALQKGNSRIQRRL